MKKLTLLILLQLVSYCSIAQGNRQDSLNKLLSRTTDLRERYNLLRELGKEYFRGGTGEYTVSNIQEQVRIALQLKNDSLIASSYNSLGDYYLYERGDYNVAVEYLFKGIPYAENIKDKHLLSSLYEDISDAYWALQNFSEQLHFVQKAEANLPSENHPDYNYILIQVKASLVLYYLSVHQPENALPQLNAAWELNLKLKYQLWNTYLESLYGGYYTETGDKDLARVYFKKAAALDSIAIPYVRFLFKYHYIIFLLKENEYANAKIQAEDLLHIGEVSENNNYCLVAAGFLKTIYEREGKVDSAYYFSKQESLLKDTIFNQEKLHKMQALNFSDEVRTKQAEEERKQNIQFALMAIGIIIFITVFLLLSRSIIVNEKVISFLGVLGLLIIFEFINLVIHPLLEKKTNHSPVIMLAVLVMIASLLIPLHHRVEKWIKEKMTEKNKRIRLAAARKTIEKLEEKHSDKQRE